MIDLRPPYPWEEQPKKPKEESPWASVGVIALWIVVVWLMFMVIPTL